MDHSLGIRAKCLLLLALFKAPHDIHSVPPQSGDMSLAAWGTDGVRPIHAWTAAVTCTMCTFGFFQALLSLRIQTACVCADFLQGCGGTVGNRQRCGHAHEPRARLDDCQEGQTVLSQGFGNAGLNGCPPCLTPTTGASHDPQKFHHAKFSTKSTTTSQTPLILYEAKQGSVEVNLAVYSALCQALKRGSPWQQSGRHAEGNSRATGHPTAGHLPHASMEAATQGLALRAPDSPTGWGLATVEVRPVHHLNSQVTSRTYTADQGPTPTHMSHITLELFCGLDFRVSQQQHRNRWVRRFISFYAFGIKSLAATFRRNVIRSAYHMLAIVCCTHVATVIMKARLLAAWPPQKLCHITRRTLSQASSESRVLRSAKTR